MLIVTILGGFASSVFLPLTTWLEERSDWRSALLVLAAVLATGTILPHALALRSGVGPMARRSAGDGETPSTDGIRELLRQPVFLRMTIGFVLQTTVSIAVAVHMIAYLVGKGQSAAFAAWAAGLIGVAQVAARIVTTLFERRFSITGMVAAKFAAQGIAVLLLIVYPTPVGIVTAVVLLGMGRGALTLLRPSLLLEFYDVRQFGVVTGVQSMAMMMG